MNLVLVIRNIIIFILPARNDRLLPLKATWYLVTQPVITAIGVSQTACEDEFRQNFDLTAGVYLYFFYVFKYISLTGA